MSTSFANSLDGLSQWRQAVGRRVDELARFLSNQDLTDTAGTESLDTLRRRLSGEKLVVAFVAEFSRGKSELINAIFFADTGRRILPATPGRTTMCPVELSHDADEVPSLALLPIASRLDGSSLAELRQQPRAWKTVPLATDAPDALAESLQEVMRTQRVSVDEARALNFWNDETPLDNPPVEDDGRVQVPAWRHAMINYPHPLLKRGLVVMDTPGLNAIGAEPELTLSLLPSAHATVFILAADTGVTKSDLAIWRDHLGPQAMSSFVVLNKIDMLRDPLAAPEQMHEQIEQQRVKTARTLEMPLERVFPLSARQALAARVDGDADALADSHLLELEAALGEQLLPQRRGVLQDLVLDAVQRTEAQVSRQLGDRRRQTADQMLELRGLRGKSDARVRLMLERVDAETAEFEQCTQRLQAMRLVHARMLKSALTDMASDRVREEVNEMQSAMSASMLNLGAKKSFLSLCARLRDVLKTSQVRAHEIRDMLDASFTRLNADYGFSLSVAKTPDIARFVRDLEMIERNYVQYLGLSQALRLSQPKFIEQFRRMLISKLRVVFENASSELELWNKSSSSQVDAQLRERRRGFRRRREALERIQQASGDLEQRIAEIEAQDAQLQALQSRAVELLSRVREQAALDITVGSDALGLRVLPVEAP